MQQMSVLQAPPENSMVKLSSRVGENYMIKTKIQFVWSAE